jgi:hypothetical protein
MKHSFVLGIFPFLVVLEFELRALCLLASALAFKPQPPILFQFVSQIRVSHWDCNPISASQVAGITARGYHTWPLLWTFFSTYL